MGELGVSWGACGSAGERLFPGAGGLQPDPPQRWWPLAGDLMAKAQLNLGD